jgi:3-hydroxybutyryl-CoA dehydrogenase
MNPTLSSVKVLVVGAGIMGAGIAQVAAQAGHRVYLMDAREGAARQACAKLRESLDALLAKGKFTQVQVDGILALIEPVDSLPDAADVGLVIEAIVENLDAKRALFADLEALLGADCVLASNTSSLSITAIAKGLRDPSRVVGMHFFNPVPLMKLVEVVSGLQTAPSLAQAIFELSKAWGKVPVHARSTPGFIVNRIARPFYAEALALMHEQSARPEVIDACMRAIGFRMGPCELMDLIGHDTNFAVTQAVYAANFFDKRYTPSLVQSALVDGGMLGRKSGRGIYDYAAGSKPPSVDLQALPLPAISHLQLHSCVQDTQTMADWQLRLQSAGIATDMVKTYEWTGIQVGALQIRQTDGRPASALGAQVVVYDWHVPQGGAPVLAFAAASGVSVDNIALAQALLSALGFAPQRVADQPGLVAARTLAMLINEAADAVQQGVCEPAGADAAMKLGVNYPAGPFEWLARWGAPAVVQVLEALDAHYRGERYRVSPWLRHALWQAQPTA